MDPTTAIDPIRQEKLKSIIMRLHAGERAVDVRRDFGRLIKGVSAGEIAAMEQSLVDGGLPVAEIQRLCEVHVEVFKAGLTRGGRVEKVPGHPIHSFVAENREAERHIRALLRAARARAAERIGDSETKAILDDLATMIRHYERKENQLFPFLETKGFTGPSKVMWGKHDEIRAQFKACAESLDEGSSTFRAEAKTLAGMMRRMVFMEERILFPASLARLTERDWALIRKGEDAIGWAWIEPGAEYDAAIVLAQTSTAPKLSELIARAEAPVTSSSPLGAIELATGALPSELLDLVLRGLPLDLSVVDENDRVLYYSDNPDRVFPRSPAVIGRDVRNCHPPKSLAIVEKILASFKSGARQSARFWIEMGGKFVVIEYRALRDAAGRYRGTLEITQEVTEIRALEGQRRLLDWE